MSAIHESFEKIANLAFGCAWAGSAASAHLPVDPAALLPVAVGAAGLIAVVASEFAKAGPESKWTLNKIRRRVKKEVDSKFSLFNPQVEIDAADKALSADLVECFLDRDALVQAAADPIGFPAKATELVMAALAQRRPDLFGDDAPKSGRDYARTVVSTALSAAIEDRDYFEDIQARLTFAQSREIARILESNGRIEAAIARVEDQIQTIPTSVQAIVDSSNRAWHGIRLETGCAEPATERLRIRPAELLRAPYRIAPFVDCGGVLSSLLSWVTQPSERRATGRLYVAPGGFGKTRLAIELLIQLKPLGWNCGFISRANGESWTPGALSELMAGAGAAGICIVVDYADSRTKEMSEIADAALACGSSGPPIRIVALARSAEGWWDSFAGEPSPSWVFDPTPFGTISEKLSAQDCSEVFQQSRAAFIERLRVLGLPHREPAQAPNLEKADSPLLVVALAFLDAIGEDLRGRSVFQTLYEEERRQWRRVLQVGTDGEAADLARAVAQTTLVQGTTVEGAVALLGADEADRSVSRSKVLAGLRRLYGASAILGDDFAPPEREAIPFICPLEPDLLGEHACIAVIQENGPSLLSATLGEVLTGPPHFADDASRILTVLVRATHPSHDPAIRRGAERAIAGVAALVPKLTAFQVVHFANSLPPRSLALSELAVTVARRLVEVAPQDSGKAAIRQRADTQSYLSARLSDRGYDEEALTASNEAVKLHRELVRIDRKESLAGLASALHLYSRDLVELGRRKDALAPSEEAVELSRELAGVNPEKLGSGLADSLRNLGETYASIGRKDDALQAIKDACGRFEALAADDPDRFLPALASALNSLCNRHFQLGQLVEALAASGKAVTLFRQLVARNRDAHLPGLAAALNNCSRDLRNVDRPDEALEKIVEALKYHRELVVKNRGGHRLGLALALQGTGIAYFDAGQREQGLADTNEAIELLGEQIAKTGDAYIPDLAATMGNLGKMQLDQQQPDAAARTYEKAAKLIRPVAVRFPDAFKAQFEYLREQYMRAASETPPQPLAAEPGLLSTKKKHAVPEGSTVFDEADRLLQILMREEATRLANREGHSEDEEVARLEQVIASEKALEELWNFLTENAADETLAPIKNVTKFITSVFNLGTVTPETSKAITEALSESFLTLKRARVKAHPEDETARRDLAQELTSRAEDSENRAELIQELHDLRKANPELDAAMLYMECHNAAVRGDDAGHNLNLHELRNLSTRYPQDAAVRVALAKES
jgi:hypothetical protein